MKALYTIEALATGEGRNGHVVSSDGLLDTEVRIPVELGGAGGAPNPEMLFAAGYAACFNSALQTVARTEKRALKSSNIGARVSIGSNGQGGFQLAVELVVAIPGLPHDQAVRLAEAAHQVCPYSNATRGNIEVQLTVVED
ncbi:MAG: organic hydroperoxide resistance protein [Microbacteriaceae bacterium]|jgi:Ohr subfamily peroxiredoxin|nr:organic hydroperoxide resistance protein [Microbacteriaceae bacterium]MCI1207628.1 organic hydroperoxide resistance protein [Microbacteriaceae bacterium]